MLLWSCYVILSLNRASIEVQRGNFSSWMANFELQQEFEMAQNERLQKDISRLQQAAECSATWSDRVEKSKNGTTNSGSKLDKGDDDEAWLTGIMVDTHIIAYNYNIDPLTAALCTNPICKPNERILVK